MQKKFGVQISLEKWSAHVTDEFLSETLILRNRLSSLYTKCVQFLPWPSLLFRRCYAGEMMIPCQVPTYSQFILYLFSISRSFSSLNKSVNDWKIAKRCQKVLKIDDVALNGAYGTQKKVWSCNKFKKMKCQCNRWVLVRNPDTPKVIVQFVHEVRSVLKWHSLLFRTCYAGEMMIPCQV